MSACSVSLFNFWVGLSFLYIMTYNENTDKIRIVDDAARHINMHTFPIDISWGSIPCLTQRVCPTWAANVSGGMAPMG